MMRIRQGTMLLVIGTLLALPARAGAEVLDNCVAVLAPIDGSTSGVIDATAVELGCYETYAEALEAGSDGAIAVDADTTPATLTSSSLAAATDVTLATSVVIGTEYTGLGFEGSSKSYFAPVSCSSTVTWEVSYVGDAWNDDFASGKGFGGCDHNKKFQHADFLGDVITCTPNCSDYAPLRNEISSLRWKP
jgi:hypothetical protein